MPLRNLRNISAVLLSLSIVLFCAQLLSAEGKEYYRIVVLSDLHLPVKTTETPDETKQKKRIEAKLKIPGEINSWKDVDLIAVTGDLVGDSGVENEFLYARDYLKKFTAPISVITGNHDFIYSDRIDPRGWSIKGTPESRKTKLEKSLNYFKIPSLCYAMNAGSFLLVFLSADSLDGKYNAELSEMNLARFRKTLDDNKTTPTLVFFHAPLEGTVIDRNNKPGSGSFVAQPHKEIDQILKANPQVFIWVSGHTHTPPTNKSFMSDMNLYDGRVMNIHNTNLDREKIWTNSLYLYKDRVVVRTYNHYTGKWQGEFDRTIYPPKVALKTAR
jgi:3',5'-cyclic-AMP phosphodiesterase